MADINQVISLGIGSPASIKFFTTCGLGIGAAPAVVAGATGGGVMVDAGILLPSDPVPRDWRFPRSRKNQLTGKRRTRDRRSTFSCWFFC